MGALRYGMAENKKRILRGGLSEKNVARLFLSYAVCCRLLDFAQGR